MDNVFFIYLLLSYCRYHNRSKATSPLLNNTVEEICIKNNSQVRTLAIDFDKDTKQIEIVGSVFPLLAIALQQKMVC
jgi:hypothetical protein